MPNTQSKLISAIIFSIFINASAVGAGSFTETLPLKCQKPSANFETSLKCAQTHFSVDGQRINPRIIQDLSALISDYGTQVYAISLLESQNSNRYFCNDVSLVVSHENCMTEKGETFDYNLVGKTDNGVFVLTTRSSGGGSGVFYNLLLVRISESNSIGEISTLSDKRDQKLGLQHKMVLIEKVGALALGDRTSPEVGVEGNTIKIKQCIDNFNVNDKIKEFDVRLYI